MTKQQQRAIMKHFADRLRDPERGYNIETKNKYSALAYALGRLQECFRKRVGAHADKYKTRLIKAYDRHKALYVTTFEGKRVKFVYSHQFHLAKTVL